MSRVARKARGEHNRRVLDAVIGSCGYKSPPSPDGVVEIAYGVDPGHQGRGYATEAARA